MSDISITISITADLTLLPSEVWPDGAPDTFTAADVKAVLEGAGSRMRVLQDWNLIDDIEVEASVYEPGSEDGSDKWTREKVW